MKKLGIMLIEAISVGLPVISTNCLGPGDIVAPNLDKEIIDYPYKSKIGVLISNKNDKERKGQSIEAMCNILRIRHETTYSNNLIKKFDLSSIVNYWESIL